MPFTDSYGELANQLILQSKLSLNLAKLLLYDGPLVRLVIQEQWELDQDIREMEQHGVTVGHERWPKVVILARVIHQNKRCLLAYHSQRLELIRASYWDAGGALGHLITNLREKLSQDEIQYLCSYHDSVAEYRNDISTSDVVDLAFGIEHPTMQLSATVETVICPGPIHTQSGIIDFRYGQRYVLPRSDVEHLIQQGYLKEVL
ncbi:hypothetical protein B0H10DRAFT_1809013 [Mycena sp. CBHHK59/15]|nr:hypothetical protein B0H10DRAFT_1809013 [Mycena sp. CBHHK59/15]